MMKSTIQPLAAFLLAIFAISDLATQPASAEACEPSAVNITTSAAPEPNPAPLRQANSQVQQAASEGKPDIVILGDSIAARWPERPLKMALGSSSLVKLGVGGDKTQNALWRLNEPAFSAWRPKKVYLVIGTNNLAARDPACAIVAGILAIVDKIDKTWMNPEITIIGIMPRGAKFDFRDADRIAINNDLKSAASKNNKVRFIDPSANIVCSPSQPCENFGKDHLHPTGAGYTIINALLKS